MHTLNMKRTLRDIAILIVSRIGLVWLYRNFIQMRRPLVRVLTFHDVQDEAWFRECINTIADMYHVISPEDFLSGTFERNEINVLITFDDGYTSWVEKCLPILSARNIHALFFINSGLIDVASDAKKQKQYVTERLLLSSRDTLSWSGVAELMHAGHTIGGHTVTHARLSELHKSMQKVEIEHDKASIEAKIGTILTMFAYPFGQKKDYTEHTEALIHDAGYTYAFTTEGVFAHMKNPFAISRICIEETLSKKTLKLWIEGGYDIFHTIKILCAR